MHTPRRKTGLQSSHGNLWDQMRKDWRGRSANLPRHQTTQKPNRRDDMMTQHILDKAPEYCEHFGLDKHNTTHLAAVAIYVDISDRAGIKHELRRIDLEVTKDMLASWCALIDGAQR